MRLKCLRFPRGASRSMRVSSDAKLLYLQTRRRAATAKRVPGQWLIRSSKFPRDWLPPKSYPCLWLRSSVCSSRQWNRCWELWRSGATPNFHRQASQLHFRSEGVLRCHLESSFLTAQLLRYFLLSVAGTLRALNYGRMNSGLPRNTVYLKDCPSYTLHGNCVQSARLTRMQALFLSVTMRLNPIPSRRCIILEWPRNFCP